MSQHAEQALMALLDSTLPDPLQPRLAVMVPELFRKVSWAISSTWSNHTHPSLETGRTEALARDTVLELLTIMNRDLSPI